MVEHFIPTTLEEALDYLNQHDTLIMSGGTDVMVQERNWAEVPPDIQQNVMYIFNLDDLRYVMEDESTLHIGANVVASDLLLDDRVPQLLRDMIDVMASPALRNMATIAGNIANASPAGDSLPILYLLDASVCLASTKGERIIPMKEFITGYRQTSMQTNELIKEVIIPKHQFTHQLFRKIGGRQADAISKVSFAGAAVVVDGLIRDFRASFGAVAITAIRDRSIEQSLIGKKVINVKKEINAIQDKYRPLIKPIDDKRSTKEYRLQVSLNLLEEFILSI